jgi:hypothetical protein
MVRWLVVLLFLVLPLPARAARLGVELTFGAQGVPDRVLVGVQPRALVFHDLASWVAAYGRLGYTYALEGDRALEGALGFDLVADRGVEVGRATFHGLDKGLRLGFGLQHATYEASATGGDGTYSAYELDSAFLEVQPYLALGPIAAGVEFRYHRPIDSSAPAGRPIDSNIAVSLSLSAKF